MFNLIVGLDFENGNSGLRSDRVLEYTAESLRKEFRDNGQLDRRIADYPALFMPEIDRHSRTPQFAQVGKLTIVENQNGDVRLGRHLSESIPPILLEPGLWGIRDRLGIEEFEFSRTHWALKEADLFEALLVYNLHHVPAPRIHGIDRFEPIDPNLISVMIRFRPDFERVFEAVREVATQLQFECQRVKEFWEKDAIISDIGTLIMRSQVVIADLTDKNANVLYEYGLAHGMGRDVIPISQDTADTFDVQHLRHIHYDNTKAGLESLSQMIHDRLQTIRGDD